MSTTETPLSIHRPSGAPKGGVIVVQEGFGVNDHIEDVGRRFAAEGWLAVAPHFYHRSGDATVSYNEVPQVYPHMDQLTPEGILEDVDAGLAWLAAAGIPSRQVGVVGFCLGGTITLVTAARRDIGAAVTFYGGGIAEGRFGFPPLVEEVTRLRAPWLGLFGDLDQGIPVDDVERLRAAAAASEHPTEIVRYPEGEHGFHCDQRPSFHPASAADGWRRTLAWFGRFITPEVSTPYSPDGPFDL
ncbi:MAG: carboxymethylenebutenolidase [Acidimicrobiaceae bacterium]|nr:carboxymethylenebutenolidase [Acidimicrobiaceae bacterium]